MKIKYLTLVGFSLFSIACLGSDLPDDDALQQQSKQLYMNHKEQAKKGNKVSCYALANYHYLGGQFFNDPEKVKMSYYTGKDGNKVYYLLGKLF